MTPLLSIVTITYNHEPFIAKTIEGVLMQQVKFPIELIIAEDCSTDGTRAICQQYAEEYPDLIRLITSDSNVGAIANERRAMLAARGKYIAFCEGDDYWTDPLKLQKQVDFLESHPDYSVTFHRCKHYNVETHEMVDDNCGYLFADNNQLGVDITTAQFFKSWITQPLTMVYRVASFDLDVALQYNYYRDMHQIYHLLQAGKGYLFAFNGGVRTRHEGGMASLLSNEQKVLTSITIAQEILSLNQTDNAVREYMASIYDWAIGVFLQKRAFNRVLIYIVKRQQISKNPRKLLYHLKQVIKHVI
jgi:glycosyltransferase involved in cell wall biosynthesis